MNDQEQSMWYRAGYVLGVVSAAALVGVGIALMAHFLLEKVF